MGLINSNYLSKPVHVPDSYNSTDTSLLHTKTSTAPEPAARNVDYVVSPMIDNTLPEKASILLRQKMKHSPSSGMQFSRDEGDGIELHVREDVDKAKDSPDVENREQEIEALRKTSRDVRRRAYANMAAAGPISRGIQYEYQSGPDGRIYLKDKSISFDTSEVKDNPDATIAKARAIRGAVLSLADPSIHEWRMAEVALKMEVRARIDKIKSSVNDEYTISNDNSDNNKPDGKSVEQPVDTEYRTPHYATRAYGRKEYANGAMVNTKV